MDGVEILSEAVRSADELHGRGYRWLSTMFEPALVDADAACSQLLADSYELLGDIHDLNEAPLAALRAYEQSLARSPGNSYCLEQAGLCLKVTGDLDGAREYLELACAADPLSESARHQLSIFAEPVDCDDRHYVMKINDALASRRFDRAKRLAEEHGVSLDLARCAGAANDKGAALQRWQRASSNGELRELAYADWFYLPDVLRETAEFWRALIPCDLVGVFPSVDEYDAIPEPQPRLFNAEFYARHSERYRLRATLELARVTKDIEQCEALSLKYPQWGSAQRLLAQLRDRQL